MGVSGLTKALKGHGTKICLSDVAQQAGGLKILVDGLAVVFSLWFDTCTSVLDNVFPAYDKFGGKLEDFVRSYAEVGITLVFYFDTTSGTDAHAHKLTTVSTRQQENVDAIVDIVDYCNGVPGARLPATNSLLPSALIWHCMAVLESMQIKIVRCMGEADFKLATDGADSEVGAYAVLSNDSDFYLNDGFRYIPFNTVTTTMDSVVQADGRVVRQHRIHCSVFTRAEVMAVLGLTSGEELSLLSALAGNDYTKQLLVDAKYRIPATLGLDVLPWGLPKIESCIAFVKRREEIFPAIAALLERHPEVKLAFAFSAQCVNNPASLIDVYDPSFDAVVANVEAGQLPSATMGVLMHHFLRMGVCCEEYQANNVSAASISRHLVAAVCFFFDRRMLTMQERTGKTLTSAMWNLDQLLPRSYFMKQRTYDLQDMVNLMYEPLLIFESVDKTHLATAEYVHLLYNGTESYRPKTLFQGQLLAHLLASSHQYGDPLAPREFFAVVLMLAILDEDPNFAADLPPLGQKYLMDSLARSSVWRAPSARSLTLSSRLIVLLQQLRALYRVIRFPAYGAVPAIGHLYNGPLLSYILHQLENGTDVSATTSAGFEVDPLTWKTVNDTYMSVAAATDFLDLPGLEKLKKPAFELRLRTLLQLAGFPFPSNVLPVVSLKASRMLDVDEDEEEEEELVDPVEAAAKMAVTRASLPIAGHKEIILETANMNALTVIQGETGCGKSSQVPQFVLEGYRKDYESGKAPRRPFIVVTQPRRIAAITLAKRVAQEMGEPIGHSIGYSIGQDRVADKGPNKTEVLFVTSGWLLQKMLFDEGFLGRCTHVILDEIHERSIDSDLLYLLVRQSTIHLLKKAYLAGHPASERVPKLVLMSATFNTQMFADYFQPCNDVWYQNGELDFVDPGSDRGDPDTGVLEVPVLFVGVKRFPVEVVHLDRCLEHPILASKDMGWNEGAVAGLCRMFRPGQMVRQQEQLVEFTVALISALVHEHAEYPEGNCVLVFLPGISEIEELYELIEQMKTAAADALIETVVLHSMIDSEEQMKAFAKIEAGWTRVVLSTNIAESSVTIPMVRYVIDFGTCRQLEHERRSGMTALKTAWVSKASALQRSGRCGRLFPGTVFRMYPESFFEALAPYDVPEMLRLSLSSTVLRLKVLADSVGEESPFKNPRRVLECALQPPEAASIESAVDRLVAAGALYLPAYVPPETDSDDDSDDDMFGESDASDPVCRSTVTAFGNFLSHVPLDMRYGKLVALGARSGRFILHALVIAVGLSMQDIFVVPHSFTDDVTGFTKLILTTQAGREYYEAGDRSDALVIVRLFLEYHLYLRTDRRGRFPMFDLAVNVRRLKQLVKTVGEIALRLEDILPNHVKWLRLLSRNSRVPHKVLEHEMSLSEADCNFMRLMMAQAFASDGLVEGKAKNSANAMGLGKWGLCSAKSVDIKRTMVIHEVPQSVMSEWAITHSIPAVAGLISRVSISYVMVQPKKGGKKSLAVGNWGASGVAQQQKGRMAIEFSDSTEDQVDVGRDVYGHLNDKARPLNSYSDEDWGLEKPVLGFRAMLSMFQRGQLVLQPLAPDGTIIPNAGGKRGGFRDRRREEEEEANGTRLVLSQPTRGYRVQWMLQGTIKCGADNHSLIASQQVFGDGKGGRTKFYAIPSTITMLGSGSQARVERMSILPHHNGLLTLALFTVYEAVIVPSGVKRGSVVTCNVPGTVLRSSAGMVDLSPAPSKEIITSPDITAFTEVLRTILDVDVSSPPCGIYNEEHVARLMAGIVDGRMPVVTPSERKSYVDDEEYARFFDAPRQFERRGGGGQQRRRQDMNQRRGGVRRDGQQGRQQQQQQTRMSKKERLQLRKLELRKDRRARASAKKAAQAAEAAKNGSVADLTSNMSGLSVSGDNQPPLTKKQRKQAAMKAKRDARAAAKALKKAERLEKEKAAAAAAPAKANGVKANGAKAAEASGMSEGAKATVYKRAEMQEHKKIVKKLKAHLAEQALWATFKLEGGSLTAVVECEGVEVHNSSISCHRGSLPGGYKLLLATLDAIKDFLPCDDALVEARAIVKQRVPRKVITKAIESGLSGKPQSTYALCKKTKCTCASPHSALQLELYQQLSSYGYQMAAKRRQILA